MYLGFSHSNGYQIYAGFELAGGKQSEAIFPLTFAFYEIFAQTLYCQRQNRIAFFFARLKRQAL
jgi:hypothetical protein